MRTTTLRRNNGQNYGVLLLAQQAQPDIHFERYTRIAFVASLGVHATLFICIVTGIGSGLGQIPDNVIYSVSIEGSNKLGGIAQVPDKKADKTPIAPPKKTAKQAAEPEVVKKQPEVKTQPEKVEKAKPVEKVEDAEISLKEKEQKPVPEEKPKPVEKASLKEKEPEKPKPKATTAPVKKVAAAPKPDKPAPPKQPTAQDVNKNFEQALQRYLGESTSAGGVGFGGDGRGGTGMGGGIVKPPAWFLYKDQLEMAVKRGWNWHDTSSQLLASVVFKISPDGVLSDVRLSRSSGNPAYDESILRAVRKASPVPVPPAEFYNDFRLVEFDFEPR